MACMSLSAELAASPPQRKALLYSALAASFLWLFDWVSFGQLSPKVIYLLLLLLLFDLISAICFGPEKSMFWLERCWFWVWTAGGAVGRVSGGMLVLRSEGDVH